MSIYARGDVVVVLFPFSDLSSSKRRPALVLWDSGQDDLILCQITASRPHYPDLAVPIGPDDFTDRGLQRLSYVLTWKVFTLHRSLVLDVAGSVKREIVDRVASCLYDTICSRDEDG